MQKLSLILLAGLLLASCRKEPAAAIVSDCDNLKQGMISDSLLLVKTTINNYIEQLPSNLHTQEDLNSLATYISSNCITASVFCYGCIFTYPGQSEIILTFNSGGNTIKRVIDIIGHPHEKMRFRNMHE